MFDAYELATLLYQNLCQNVNTLLNIGGRKRQVKIVNGDWKHFSVCPISTCTLHMTCIEVIYHYTRFCQKKCHILHIFHTQKLCIFCQSNHAGENIRGLLIAFTTSCKCNQCWLYTSTTVHLCMTSHFDEVMFSRTSYNVVWECENGMSYDHWTLQSSYTASSQAGSGRTSQYKFCTSSIIYIIILNQSYLGWNF